LDLTWSHRTLRSNLDRLTAWERDFDVKARVQIAAASFKVSTENPQKRKCPKRERAGVITVVRRDIGAESVEKAERTLEKSTFLANFFSAFLLL